MLFHEIANLTTDSDNQEIALQTDTSLCCDGAFGSGTVQFYAMYKDSNGDTQTSAISLDDSLDGSDNKTIHLPAGRYNAVLEGSAGANLKLVSLRVATTVAG